MPPQTALLFTCRDCIAELFWIFLTIWHFLTPETEIMDDNIENISNYSGKIKVRETLEKSSNDLFLLLKSHIDSQFKLNQLNQCRIRSFEIFRRYCQRVASFGNDDDGTKFDLEQFRNEYNRFDRNYRHWRKRIQKLRKETKSLSNQNPYDILYELFAKIECLETRSKDISNPNSQESKGSSLIHRISFANNQSPEDQSNQCNFKDFFDGRSANHTKKHPHGCPSKTKGPNICPDQLSSSTRERVESSDSDGDFFIDDYVITNYSSEDSEDILKVIRSRKSVNKAKKKSVKKDKIETKLPKTKATRSKCQSVDLIHPEISLNLIEPSESFFQNYLKNAEQSNENSLERDCKQTIKDKRSIASEQSAKKDEQPKIVKSKNSDNPSDNPRKNQMGNAKKLKTEKKVIRCDVEGCQYSCKNLSILKMHQVLHSDERPFQCDKCGKSYKWKGGLTLHQNVHQGKRFHCTFEGCNRHYSMSKDLQKHIKIIHTKELPLLHCDWEGCLYSSYRFDNLKTHQKIHTDQREYKCPHCEATFKTQATLWSHRLKHENKDGFKCDFEDCQFSTHSKPLLKNHKRTHFDERLFSCAWPGCDDSFKTYASLASHRLKHENLRRYKCSRDGCSYASNLSSSLKSHIDEVHKKMKRKRRSKRTNLESRISSSNSK